MTDLVIEHGDTMKLVDRETELGQLKAALNERPALIVLRGRRRIGKSYLLAAAFETERLISLQADEQDERGHLDLFAQEASRLLPGSPPLAFTSWDQAFHFIGTQTDDPLCMVLDEFQWLCHAQPALPSILQRHWDSWQREQKNIVVAIAGSALSFMSGLLAEDSPLHGRATYRPTLLPLDYRQAAGFSQQTDPVKLLQRYAVLGGTPQYQTWAGDEPLARIIAKRLLVPGRPLYDDPLHLLREGEGVRSPGSYLSVLWSVARGDTRFNEISNRTGLRAQSLVNRIDRLGELGYLELYTPSDPKPSKPRGSYRIADPFFRFWFRYIFPNRSRLELGRTSEVLAEIEADLDNHMGAVFEECCRMWIARYAPHDHFGPIDELGAWWSRDGSTEIDIAAHHDGRFTVLGSVKWAKQVSGRVLDRLEESADQLGSRGARAQLVLFARNGFTSQLSERAYNRGVRLVTAKELFQ